MALRKLYHRLQNSCNSSSTINLPRTVSLREKAGQLILNEVAATFYNSYKLLTRLTISLNDIVSGLNAVIESTICHPDLTPLRAQNLGLITSLEQYTLRVNTSLKLGSFFISEISGTIFFKTTCTVNDLYCDWINRFEQQTLPEHRNTAIAAFEFHLNRFLVLFDEQNIQEYQRKREINTETRSISRKCMKYSQEIESIIFHTEILEVCEENKNLLSLPKIQSSLLRPSFEIEAEELHFNNNQSNGSNFSTITNRSSDQERITKRIKCESNEYITELQKQTFYIPGQGTFVDLSINTATRIEKRLKKRKIIRKNREDPSLFELNVEKAVISSLSTSHHPSIATHYLLEANDDDTDEAFRLKQNSYLLKDYVHGTLDQFLYNVPYMSFHSKLWIFAYIADGIRFLNTKGLIHTDIEPGTIFMDHNHLPKIAALEKCFIKQTSQMFGNDSVSAKEYLKQFKPPRKVPYTPPELLKEIHSGEEINEKTPVYLFGMLMFNILFEMKPLSYKKESYHSLYRKIANNTHKLVFSEESASRKGPAEIMRMLRILALKCVEPENNRRPRIEDVIIVLRKTINMLNRLYSY